MQDFIPVLGSGKHESPKEGACIMEMVSFMTNDKWTDYPECSNQAIAVTAQSVNDTLPDEDRHLIMAHFDRLFNTTDVSTKEMRLAILKHVRNEMKENIDFYRIRVDPDILRVAKTLIDEESLPSVMVYYSHMRKLRSSQSLVDFLGEVLDIYDELSGRNEVVKQDTTKLKEMQNA